MQQSGLIRLCEPLKTGGVFLPGPGDPIFGTEPNWQIHLFRVSMDEQILVQWKAGQEWRGHGQASYGAFLSDSFEEIAASEHMQAFVVWNGVQPVLQIDVVNANSFLAEIVIPFEGAYLLYIKYGALTGLSEFTQGLSVAMEFFLQFPEVTALYAVVEADEISLIEGLVEAGFNPMKGDPMDLKQLMVYLRNI